VALHRELPSSEEKRERRRREERRRRSELRSRARPERERFRLDAKGEKERIRRRLLAVVVVPAVHAPWQSSLQLQGREEEEEGRFKSKFRKEKKVFCTATAYCPLLPPTAALLTVVSSKRERIECFSQINSHYLVE
jgi:hypothetical protein